MQYKDEVSLDERVEIVCIPALDDTFSDIYTDPDYNDELHRLQVAVYKQSNLSISVRRPPDWPPRPKGAPDWVTGIPKSLYPPIPIIVHDALTFILLPALLLVCINY